MTVLLGIVFLASLAGIAILTFFEGRQQNKVGSLRGGATMDDWAAVARGHDLQVVTRSGLHEPLIRGTISDRWVTVEDQMSNIEINVSFRSGTDTFTITDRRALTGIPKDQLLTDDSAFDSSLSVTTRSPEELLEYLTPARRNALLWLVSDDSIEIDHIDEEMINVCFSALNWKPAELIAAIDLVVDVANIMEAGEKVFMTPPMPVSDAAGDDTPPLSVV